MLHCSIGIGVPVSRFDRFGVGAPGRFLFVSDSDTSDQGLTCFITETAQENENQVNKPAKSKQAASQQPDDTSSGLANIETVCAEPAKEQAQKESDPPILMNVAKTAIVINIVVNNVDNRLLILGLYRICACVGSTIGAELDTLCNFFSAILAIHTIDLSFLFAAYNLYACFREVPLPDMVCNGCFFVSELDTCITMIDYVFLFFP